MKKTLAVLSCSVFLLSGCAFWDALTSEETLSKIEEAAISTIESLNNEGFDPLALSPNERALARSACEVVKSISTQVIAEDKKERLEALLSSVCVVLDKALEDAPEVEEVNG